MFIKRFTGAGGENSHRVGRYDNAGNPVYVYSEHPKNAPRIAARIEVAYDENKEGREAARKLLQETLAELDNDSKRIITLL